MYLTLKITKKSVTEPETEPGTEPGTVPEPESEPTPEYSTYGVLRKRLPDRYKDLTVDTHNSDLPNYNP